MSRASLYGGSTSPRVQVIDKGNFLNEIARLQQLERHHQRISEIQNRSLNKYSSVESLQRAPVSSQLGAPSQFSYNTATSKKPSQFKKEVEQFEINKQNIKILQRIVDAR
jgi:uncharacterized protein with von Willebrand factor type A (vWA) domain